ncbi:MAG: DUF2842 domain-containing protein [Allosphingosinicella sp.]
MTPPYQPTWRKPAGILLILLLIAAWAALAATAASLIEGWPALAQAPFYLVAGIAWLLPMKPLLRWMETGSLRRR